MGLTTSHDIINALRSQLGLDETVGAVMRVWDKEFAHQYPYAVLQGIKNKTLLVDVASTIQAQEFSLQKYHVVKQINHYFGTERPIKNIRVRLAS
jgi:hypothetical protein